MIFATDFPEPRRARLVRWAGAAVLVAAAHVACTALALVHLQEDEAEDARAAAVLIEMTAPAPQRQDTPDVAHGPLMEEAKLTPQAAKETKEVVEKETPPVDRSPAPNPEVVLPKQQPTEEKKPELEQPKEETPQQQSTEQAAAAPLTTAPPRVEAKEEARPAAPAPGISVSNARARASWERSLVSHLNRFKRYPEIARTRGNQGAVNVEFTIDRAGRVLASRVVRSSGSDSLDEEALAVLQRASPLPAPPGQVAGMTFDLVLPIQFRIR
jgi:protein TonB